MGYRDYSTAKGHIVDASGHGDFTTIQAAINAASSGQDIFVRSGTYTEDLTLKDGVNISAFDGDSDTPTVTIIGKMTLTSGTVAIGSIRLQTNADFVAVISGISKAIIVFDDCFFNFTNHTGISVTNSNALSGFSCYQCNGLLGMAGITWHDSTSPGNIGYNNFFDMGAGETTTPSNNSAGQVNIYNSNFSNPLSTSGTGGLGILHSNIDTNVQNTTSLTFNGTGSTNIRHCTVSSGTATAVTIGVGATCGMIHTGIGSSNANALSGLGTLNYADLAFISASSTIGVSTATPLTWKPFATAGTSVTAVRGTTGFSSTDFTVTNGFVQLNGFAGFDWNVINQGTQPANFSVNNGYICQAGGTGNVSMALPATSTLGDIIEIVLDGATTWKITQAAGQQIRFANSQTTAGVGGSISTTGTGDAIRLVCETANLKWLALSAVGNLTVT